MFTPTSTGTPAALPTLSDIQRRLAELTGTPLPPPRAQRPTAPPPVPASPHRAVPDAALYGLAGRFVRTVAPHTEAHPAALLLQFLAAFGNAVGPALHCRVGDTRHRLNLFVVLVGESGKGRKGTSWHPIHSLFARVDSPWVAACIMTARLSAGALVDAIRGQQPPADRRLLLLSEEFAPVLNALKGARGHLSPLLRGAWDNGQLSILDGRQPVPAANTHISLVAHITGQELAQHLQPAEAHNGFANRCLWTSVHRSQLLPGGGSLPQKDLDPLVQALRRTLDYAAAADPLIRRDEAAETLWKDRYPALSQASPGLFGAATNRAEAQVLRLSAIYAVLDSSSFITVPHLQAALAVWDYCSASALALFGTSTGDPIADRIKHAVEAAEEGLSRKQIRALFHGHIGSDRIQASLDQLLALGAIFHQRMPGAGRPATLWAASPAEEQTGSDLT